MKFVKLESLSLILFSFCAQFLESIETIFCSLPFYQFCYLYPSFFCWNASRDFPHSFFHLFLLFIRPYFWGLLLFYYLFLFFRQWLFYFLFFFILYVLSNFNLSFFFKLLSLFLQFDFLFSFDFKVSLLFLLNFFCFTDYLFLRFSTIICYNRPTIDCSRWEFNNWKS